MEYTNDFYRLESSQIIFNYKPETVKYIESLGITIDSAVYTRSNLAYVYIENPLTLCVDTDPIIHEIVIPDHLVKQYLSLYVLGLNIPDIIKCLPDVWDYQEHIDCSGRDNPFIK